MPYICKCCGTHQPGQSDGWCGRPECRSAAEVAKRALRNARDAQVSRTLDAHVRDMVTYLRSNAQAMQEASGGARVQRESVAVPLEVAAVHLRMAASALDEVLLLLEREPPGAGGGEAPR